MTPDNKTPMKKISVEIFSKQQPDQDVILNMPDKAVACLTSAANAMLLLNGTTAITLLYNISKFDNVHIYLALLAIGAIFSIFLQTTLTYVVTPVNNKKSMKKNIFRLYFYLFMKFSYRFFLFLFTFLPVSFFGYTCYVFFMNNLYYNNFLK